MGDVQDIPLQRQSTTEAVADTIMRMIISGLPHAGEPLRESSLATRLGISRNSVREGIRLLERSRPAKYEIHRGSVVKTPTLEDLGDLSRTRLHLELLAAQVVPTPEESERIWSAFAQREAASTSQVVESVVAADLALHQAIVALLRSERLTEFFTQISEELRFYFTVLSFDDDEHLTSENPIVEQHHEIVDAICGGRWDDAVRLLRGHIDQNFHRLQEIIVTQSSHSVPLE